MTESFAQDFSIPRGGPIYTPNMVSPLTRVSDFETSMLHELHNLHTDLRSESIESCDDDILVDELKIVTDEELVSMAFDEAFKDGHQVDDKMSTRTSNSCLDSSRSVGCATNMNSSNSSNNWVDHVPLIYPEIVLCIEVYNNKKIGNSKDEALEKWEWIVSDELQKKQKEHLGSATASQLPCFRSVEMNKTRFCDLRFRVGAGYVYCHQGDCKHIFVKMSPRGSVLLHFSLSLSLEVQSGIPRFRTPARARNLALERRIRASSISLHCFTVRSSGGLGARAESCLTLERESSGDFTHPVLLQYARAEKFTLERVPLLRDRSSGGNLRSSGTLFFRKF
ncbi:hypothetical protein HYC85_008255 [Camellia sinensis]|uniref:Uncharacterized protein n=1 Tax=Camellia sinensis TaxID=4442 RepID=A0A7J7HS06_CAMSI|nr:hypothetical protein HYC85_008255 [Camellia sinensis]